MLARLRWHFVLAWVIGIATAARAGLLFAGEEFSPDEFQAAIEAGEFAPALAFARATIDPRVRDERLSILARAQPLGMGCFADCTRFMGSDEARAETLSALGGAAQADFDAVIELITATIAPESWSEVGGAGAIDSFAGGVYVDPQGVLRSMVLETADGPLGQLRRMRPADATVDARQASTLRKISLPRLERELQLRFAAGKSPDETMRTLAGLQRIRYVFVYPELNDVVIAGPAGDWKTTSEARIVSTDSGQPIVRLDDLVTVFRAISRSDEPTFGCSIVPAPEALARTQEFLTESAKKPLAVGQRDKWLRQLRDKLGLQAIEIDGIDPQSRTARVLVEADYHMKLVGMGLVEAPLGVTNYLDSIVVPEGEAPPPLDVLRWWFTLNYQAVLATPDRNAFVIRGQGVKVLSENELLAARGQRVHTGRSDELNQQFVSSFTRAFPGLCQRYPVYGELRNIFDLALVAALIRSEKLGEKAEWNLTSFGNDELLDVPRGAAPKSVETVIRHRIVNKKHVLVGVSGGVEVSPLPFVDSERIETDTYGLTAADRKSSQTPRDLAPESWWWD